MRDELLGQQYRPRNAPMKGPCEWGRSFWTNRCPWTDSLPGQIPDQTNRSAKAAAGDNAIGLGGANFAQQFIQAGLLDEIVIHLVPVFLGGGVRRFDQLTATPFEFEPVSVSNAPGATHRRFRVVNDK